MNQSEKALANTILTKNQVWRSEEDLKLAEKQLVRSKTIKVLDELFAFTDDIQKSYIEADKELNNSYAKLAKQLNSQQKSKLKRGQLAWIRERNDQCSYNNDEGFFVNMGCATRVTTERVNFLNDRVRECSAGSCRDSRLGE